MNSLHVKKNDMVVVLSGEDKGKVGGCWRRFPKSSACWSRA